jgi:hypothetical protein
MTGLRAARVMASVLLATLACEVDARPVVPSFGVTAGLNVAYHSISSPVLAALPSYGLGTLGLSGALVSLYGGVHAYLAPYVLISVVFSGAGAGGYTWSHVLGGSGDFAMYADAFDILAEVHLTYPLIPGIHPFVGGGYSVSTSLNDDQGSGFLYGRGPVATGGFDIALSRAFAEVNDTMVICPRVGVIYRFPYRYEGFYLDRQPVTADLAGFLAGIGSNGSAGFFTQPMDASAFSVYVGFHVSFALTKPKSGAS